MLRKIDNLEICDPAPLKLDAANHVPSNVPAFELAARGELVLRKPELVAQTTHLRANDVTRLTFQSGGNALDSTHHLAQVRTARLRRI